MDIGLIGFGGVGQALIKLLIDKESYLLQQYNLKINVKMYTGLRIPMSQKKYFFQSWTQV